MGYALFTARKMSLQTKVNNYNLKLSQLSREQDKLTEQTARNQKKNNNIDAAQNKGRALASTAGTIGGFLLGGPIGASIGEALGGAVGDTINSGVDACQETKQAMTEAELTRKQNELDTEKTKIETLLKAASAELDSVSKQEDQAIKSATPSYVG